MKYVHACASVTKQYNLIPAKWRRCSAVAGKVTVSMASDCHSATDSDSTDAEAGAYEG